MFQCEIEKIWFHSITTEMCCQVIFITDSLQYFFFYFYQLPATAWDGMPAVSAMVRASHGRKALLGKLLTLLRVNAQALNGPFKSVPENLTQTPVRSLWDVPFLSLPLVSFGHRSAFLAHSFTGHRFCLTLPNTCLSASVWNSIFSDIDWIFMHFFFFSRQVVFLKAHRMRLCLIMCPSKIFQHISAVKPCWAYFLKSEQLIAVCVRFIV